MSFKIDLLEEGELEGLTDFYKNSYGPKNILLQEDFFDWFIKKSPFLDSVGPKNEYPIVVVKHNNKIVGNWIYIPSFFNYFGKKFTMAWTANLIVSPELQQKGLGVYLVRYLFDKFDVLAATGVGHEVKGGKQFLVRMGYGYCDLNRYIIPFCDDILQLMQDPEEIEVKNQIAESKKKINQVLGDSSQFNIQETSFNDQYDLFWKKEIAPKYQGGDKSAVFMEWRYLVHPIFNYKVVGSYNQKGELHGIMVFRIEMINPLKINACRLVEFMPSNKSDSSLLKFLINYALEKKCAFIDFSCSTDDFDKTFLNFGFLKNDNIFAKKVPRLTQPPAYKNFIVNMIGRKGTQQIPQKDFLNFNKWYATSGDGDQDRPNIY